MIAQTNAQIINSSPSAVRQTPPTTAGPVVVIAICNVDAAIGYPILMLEVPWPYPIINPSPATRNSTAQIRGTLGLMVFTFLCSFKGRIQKECTDRQNLNPQSADWSAPLIYN